MNRWQGFMNKPMASHWVACLRTMHGSVYSRPKRLDVDGQQPLGSSGHDGGAYGPRAEISRGPSLHRPGLPGILARDRIGRPFCAVDGMLPSPRRIVPSLVDEAVLQSAAAIDARGGFDPRRKQHQSAGLTLG